MNINDIAKLAHGKKYTKKQAYNVVRDMIDQQIGKDIDLSILYGFFQPAIPAKPKTDSQWVAKALPGKSDTRYLLHYLYSDGSRLVSTDGHRMHILHGTATEKGFYDKNLVKIDLDSQYQYQYPNFDAVIPTEGTTEITYYENIEAYPVKVDPYGTHCVQINDGYVDQKYLRDAICRFDKNKPIELLHKDARSAVSLKQDDLLAVIMPRKFK